MIGKGFSGIVNTDRYAAYHWLVGAGLLEEVREIFDLWRQARAGGLSREEFRQQMEPIQAG